MKARRRRTADTECHLGIVLVGVFVKQHFFFHVPDMVCSAAQIDQVNIFGRMIEDPSGRNNAPWGTLDPRDLTN